MNGIFRCLTNVVKLPNVHCQTSGLHGCNHLKDDRCRLVIDNYIKSCRDPGIVRYALLCKTYTAL